VVASLPPPGRVGPPIGIPRDYVVLDARGDGIE